MLSKFFKVHPGYLVDDPEGYHTELTSDLRTSEGKLDVWLLQGSEHFVSDPEISNVLIKAARGAVSDAPGDDVRKRLMVVPRCHVSRLTLTNDTDGLRIDGVGSRKIRTLASVLRDQRRSVATI